MTDLNSLTARQTRRGFLGTILAGSAIGMLGACTVTKSGNVTTITVNVAKVKAYGTALVNAVATILSVAAFASAIGTPTVTIIETASAALETALDSFASAAGSTVTVDYDTTSWKTLLNSIYSDAETLVAALDSAVTGASTKVTSSALSTATTALDAAKTVLSAFQALLGITSAKRAISPRRQGMTLDQALNVLHAKAV
ncbi:hypothetical protein AD929_15540 [Gluconobacter potus]|uniref:Uncharacterized protein n=1 Tax=Gluconobacter potus TaxID=2724927 RepID=A0A149QQA3_9PROT|nr:hypothetical protein [Gluconobacter potus]KXU99488.1 hypothetical protein AD929_15540 [Gluconobacter potus]